MNNQEPERIAIEVVQLREWLEAAQDGLDPLVVYRPDASRLMLDDAYEQRGEKLKFLRNELRLVVPSR